MSGWGHFVQAEGTACAKVPTGGTGQSEHWDSGVAGESFTGREESLDNSCSRKSRKDLFLL